MANSVVVRKGTSLERRERSLRAAQYVRMSTDFQRYSIQNQAAVIATFARDRNLTIVRTFTDEGRSGLRIKGRPGLIELIECVQSGEADFGHILVYDVSRWGRFQDADESAHYEFICKENGVKVSYCAELFDNDGTLLASIAKNIKRVMAAEYSRELSVKVRDAQCRVAKMGYRMGGPLSFGLRRELVDERHQSKGYLGKGERKYLQTDRVLLRRGTREEAKIVKWIFEQFVKARKTYSKIARELNQAAIPNKEGGEWTGSIISKLLANENYIGNLLFNRGSRHMGQRLFGNPVDMWIRKEGILEPTIDPKLFADAQRALAERRRLRVPEEEMLRRLRLLLKRKGKLSQRIIDDSYGVSCVSSLVEHFGSMRKVYELIGWKVGRDCSWHDSKKRWSGVVWALAEQVAEVLGAELGAKDRVDETCAVVTSGGLGQVVFTVARQSNRPAPYWRVYRTEKFAGLLVVSRLNEGNRDILDYLLLPASAVKGHSLHFSKRSLKGAMRVETSTELIQTIRERLARASKAKR